MTEFETATLAFQQAMLAAQQAANEPKWTEVVSIIVTGVIGLTQCAIIWSGIRNMLRDSDKRGKEHQKRHEEVMAAFAHQGEESARQGEADARRHAETMEALRQQGEALRQQGEAFRDAVHQQGEAFHQQGEALRQQGEALRQQGEALRVLIERTDPAAQSSLN